MPTNWVTPAVADLAGVLDDPILKALPNKEKNLALTVARVRGAIQNGGKISVSVTPGTVPPESEIHVLVLSVMLGVASKPTTAAIVDDNGNRTGFGTLVQNAERWLDGVQKGASVTPPTDPVGADGITAVTDANPAVSAVRYGSVDNIVEADLTTYGAT